MEKSILRNLESILNGKYIKDISHWVNLAAFFLPHPHIIK